MNKLLIAIFFTASSLFCFAQNTVAGKVTDPNNEPLIGVTVLIKGTNKGAATDFDGGYVIDNVAPDAVLVFSYLGFKTLEIPFEGQRALDVVMSPSSEQLDEVILVGYGEVRASEITVSASKLSVEDLAKTATANFDQALAGRAAGVQVTSIDGTPGEGLNIVIRGGNSITGDNSPLYVVDGIPLEDFDPASISTSDIESFQVIKDAAGTAIYGSRGANGVIIISTKSGRTDSKTSIKISSRHSIQQINNRLKVLNPYDYVQYQYEGALAQDNYTPSTPNSDVQDFYNKWGTDLEIYRNPEAHGLIVNDWQDQLFRLASTDQYNISVSGGNDVSTLYLSSEFLNQEGTLINTGFKKIINNIKVTHNVSDKTKITGNIQFAYSNRSGLEVRGDKFISVIRDAIQFRPVEPLNNDGLEIGGADPNDGNERFLFNPIKNLENTDRQDRSEVIRGNLTLDHDFNDYLSVTLRGNYQINNRKQTLFYGEETVQGSRGNDKINGQVIHRRYENLSSSNTITYKRKFDRHKINLLGGFEIQQSGQEYSFFKNSQIPTDIFGIDKLGLGTSPSIPETSVSENRLLSYFGRLNYDYKGKYLLTAIFRADGSSKFAEGNRWGYFPSASFAWRIDKEKFFKKQKFISNAKIRTGWGIVGNNRIGDFEALSQLDIDSGSGYVWGQSEIFIPGAYQSNLGVPDLKWETTEQLNLGLDFGLLDNRISSTIDYYKKKTTDLLLRAESAPHTGFDRVQQNVGAVQNEGLEFTLNTVNINNTKFKWESSFNISFNKNKTLALNSGQDAIFQDPEWSNDTSEPQYITQVGQPVGMIYGLIFDGIYQISDFESGTILKDGVPDNGTIPVAPGSVKFVDQNGDGTVNVNDRVVIGNPHPKHFGGLNNNFQIGGFDIDVLLQWSYDFDILNANQAVFSVPKGDWKNGFNSLSDAWTPTNTSTTRNAFRYQNVIGVAPDGNRIDNRYIEDGSYLSLRSVSIGYNLPSDLMEKMSMNNIRIFITGQNLYTWTDYSGYHPDVSVGRFGALTPNLDWSAYPQSMTIMFGIDITF